MTTREQRREARRVRAEARDAVAFVLACGLVVAINIVVVGVLYDALNTSIDETAISENATQLLTMAIGGIIGVLGSYIGGKGATIAAQAATDSVADRDDPADHVEPDPPAGNG